MVKRGRSRPDSSIEPVEVTFLKHEVARLKKKLTAYNKRIEDLQTKFHEVYQENIKLKSKLQF